jgi:hypothetical protein
MGSGEDARSTTETARYCRRKNGATERENGNMEAHWKN